MTVGSGSRDWQPKEALVWPGEARESEREAAHHGRRRASKLGWCCLFSRLALALIGSGTGSVPSWRTLALYGKIRSCLCSGLVLALAYLNWLACL